MTSPTLPADPAERSYAVRVARPDDLPAVRALMVRTFEEDFGYGYRPDFHADVDDLQGVYLDHPRHTLLVAVAAGSGRTESRGGRRRHGGTGTLLGRSRRGRLDARHAPHPRQPGARPADRRRRPADPPRLDVRPAGHRRRRPVPLRARRQPDAPGAGA